MHLTLRRKLILSFAAVLALTVLMGAGALVELGIIGDLTRRNYRGQESILRVGQAIHEASHVRECLLAAATLEAPAARAAQLAAMAGHQARVEALAAEHRAASTGVTLEALSDFDEAWKGACAANASVGRLLEAGARDEAHRALLGDSAAKLNHATDLLDLLQDIADNGALARYESTVGAQARGRTSVVLLLVLATLVGLGLALALSGRITREVTALAVAASRIAAGGLQEDLGALEAHTSSAAGDAAATDEVGQLGRAFGGMVGGLRTFVTASQSVAASADTSVQRVKGSLSTLNSGYAEQAAAVSQTVSTLEQIRASAMNGRDRARSVLEEAQRTQQVSKHGAAAVRDVVQGMRTIREKVEQISTSIVALAERSLMIGEITEKVSAVADQSRLVALNASIEAAKAGEYGRGFAVVATEVRDLAARSQAATQEIRGLLKEIQSASRVAVKATEEGSKAMDQGLALTDSMREAIDALERTITGTSVSVEQISCAVEQQAAGVDQIGASMRGIQEAVRDGLAEAKAIEGAVGALAQEISQLVTVAYGLQRGARGDGGAPSGNGHGVAPFVARVS